MKRRIVVMVAVLSFLFPATQSNTEMKISPEGVTFPNASTQTTASAPPWSQILSAAERFDLVMGTWASDHWIYPAVLDKETGLVWQRDTDDTARDWNEACSYCYQLSLGGRKGWRMPTIEELASLVDPLQATPALPTGHPFTNVKLSPYWSSSTYATSPDYTWGVHFLGGYVCYYNKDNHFSVRCVRGGHGHDAQ
jgi:hypothetical protein